MIASQLLFLFSVLGAVNGIFLALYFFTRRAYRLTNAMLGVLLIAVGVRTIKSAFYYFNPDLAGEFIQFGLSACVLIGPLTWLYVRSYLADLQAGTVAVPWRGHLLAALGIIGIGVAFPYADHQAAWRYVVCGIHLYWFACLSHAGRLLWQSRALLRQADSRFSRNTILLLGVYIGSGVILAAYVITPFTSYIVGALSFTFSLHVTILSCIVHIESTGASGKKEKYQHRKLADSDAAVLLAALNRVMREQQLYLNPNLSLALLAKKAGSLPTTVSQAINDNLKKSFNLYINEFRVQHARGLLTGESRMTMELVAERSGFNSNSTFFSAFKKVTGHTPASYRALRAAEPSGSRDAVGGPVPAP